jgi:hypothetical protein
VHLDKKKKLSTGKSILEHSSSLLSREIAELEPAGDVNTDDVRRAEDVRTNYKCARWLRKL